MAFNLTNLLFTFSLIVTVFASVSSVSNYERDFYVIDAYEQNKDTEEKVQVKLLYESLCPDCIRFDTSTFKQAILKLGKYLDISTYPYGNAETIKYKDGRVQIKCQHGVAECYGNKLHACALDALANKTQALLYNACMMDAPTGRGSDDHSADRCGQSMQIDADPIKKCAKGRRGTQLLYYYGEESRKVNYDYVPYILINGKVSDEDNFMKDICNAFASPPPQCVH